MRADRIINEVQWQARIHAVAERVEVLKTGDAFVENAVAALRVHILRRITRQRGDDFHLVRSQKLCQALLLRLEENR